MNTDPTIPQLATKLRVGVLALYGLVDRGLLRVYRSHEDGKHILRVPQTEIEQIRTWVGAGSSRGASATAIEPVATEASTPVEAYAPSATPAASAPTFFTFDSDTLS